MRSAWPRIRQGGGENREPTTASATTIRARSTRDANCGLRNAWRRWWATARVLTTGGQRSGSVFSPARRFPFRAGTTRLTAGISRFDDAGRRGRRHSESMLGAGVDQRLPGRTEEPEQDAAGLIRPMGQDKVQVPGRTNRRVRENEYARNEPTHYLCPRQGFKVSKNSWRSSKSLISVILI